LTPHLAIAYNFSQGDGRKGSSSLYPFIGSILALGVTAQFFGEILADLRFRIHTIADMSKQARCTHHISSSFDLLHRVAQHASPFLRTGVILGSIVVILVNVAALVILFTFDSESAGFITGGDPNQFYEELRIDLLDDYGLVFGIAHNAGNQINSTVKALAYGADIIEIDVVLVRGKLHAAHWSPFRFIGNRLFRGPTLAEVWEAAAQAEMVKLDLKDASPEMVNSLVEFLNDKRRANKDVVVVTKKPEILASLAQQKPEAIRLLSVPHEKDLLALLKDEDLLQVIDGVSVYHRLLTEDTVVLLREKGLIIFAYTVNDAERMNELVEHRVSGITTDNLAILDLLGAQQGGEATLRGQLHRNASN